MIVFGGEQLTVLPFRSRCWLEDPGLRLQIPEDGRRRPEGQEIRAVVVHSTKGKKGARVLPGLGRPGAAACTFRYWSGNAGQAGAHFVVDRDGTVCQGADPVAEIAYHCPGTNKVSVGVEVFQTGDAEFWDGQLDAVADLVSWLCERLAIPRLVHLPYRGPLPGITAARGVYGHRDVTDHRGEGDPGDPPLRRLVDRSGFLPVDLCPVPSPHEQRSVPAEPESAEPTEPAEPPPGPPDEP